MDKIAEAEKELRDQDVEQVKQRLDLLMGTFKTLHEYVKQNRVAPDSAVEDEEAQKRKLVGDFLTAVEAMRS